MPDAISGYTKLEIITAAVFPLGYSSSDLSGDLLTHLGVIFDDVLIDFSGRNDWKYLHTTATLSLTSGIRTYNFQSNSIYVDDIEAIIVTTTGSTGRIHKANYKDLVSADPDSTKTGRPNFYAWWGDQTIYFDRQTDQTYSATLLYRRIVPMVTDSSSYPIVPRKHQRCLIDGVRAGILADKGDSRSLEYKEKYEDSIVKSINKENVVLESGLDSMGDDESIPGYQPSYYDVLARKLG